MRQSKCKYHCRNCESHFSSLAAFDQHRRGGYCSGGIPELIPKQGICDIGDPENIINCTIYETKSAQRLRDIYAK